MAKVKTVTDIQINPNAGSSLTQEDIEKVVAAASSKGLPSNVPFIFTGYGLDYFDEFRQVREFNKQRFVNYCHKGTVLQHGTSGVKWEVLGLEDRVVEQDGPFFSVIEIKQKLMHIQSLNNNTKRKPIKKCVNIDQFYMYDVLEVPEAVKVLWGDPKDNPKKSPSYSK